jgi:hypothetical protein
MLCESEPAAGACGGGPSGTQAGTYAIRVIGLSLRLSAANHDRYSEREVENDRRSGEKEKEGRGRLLKPPFSLPIRVLR